MVYLDQTVPGIFVDARLHLSGREGAEIEASGVNAGGFWRCCW
jgi:hypothetical protein